LTWLDEGINCVDESISSTNVHKTSAKEHWPVFCNVPFAHLVPCRSIDLAIGFSGFPNVPGFKLIVAIITQTLKRKGPVQDVGVQKVPLR